MKQHFQWMTWLCVAVGLQVQAQNLIRKPLLGKPTHQSVAAKVFLDADAEVRAIYGSSTGQYPNATTWQPATAHMPCEVLISGLMANTAYVYRLEYRSPGGNTATQTAEGYFHTQRSSGSSFVFTIQADPHMDASSNGDLFKRCLQNQFEDQPDFMVDLGDFLMTDKLKNLTTNQIPHDTITYRANLLRDFYETVGHSIPLFNVLGNHEGEAGWNLNNTANSIAVWDTQERNKFFINPEPNGFYTGDSQLYPFVGPNNSSDLRRAYYAWTWGDALFVVLDPYWSTSPKPNTTANTGWYWSLGQAQYNWLKTTLENSTAPFKFVFAHQLVGGDPEGRGGIEFADYYEWGGKNSDGTDGFAAHRPGWPKPIKDILTDNHVTVFFHGHDHFYDKQDKDCLVYQETPQPSLPNFNDPQQAAAYGYLAGQILANSGHLRVRVSSTQIQVDYVRAFLPTQETSTRHNKDVSATYTIGLTNCYTLSSSVLWNAHYADQMVYPNPFSRATTFDVAVTDSQPLTIQIVNSLGQVIKTLISHVEVDHGRYKMIWDGSQNDGSMAADGMYLYQIQQVGHAPVTGKIILQR